MGEVTNEELAKMLQDIRSKIEDLTRKLREVGEDVRRIKHK